MHSETCPVCQGSGYQTTRSDAENKNVEITCNGCLGKGWVEVSDSPTNEKADPNSQLLCEVPLKMTHMTMTE